MKIAVYPGSFDPITNGHLDVLKRAVKVFDKVILLVANNPEKKERFSCEERVEMAKIVTAHLNNVEVDSTSGLTVEYAKQHNASHLIRGLRAASDFEYESKLADDYNKIAPDIDIVFFMARGKIGEISSSKAFELYQNNMDISMYIPKLIIKYLEQKKRS